MRQNRTTTTTPQVLHHHSTTLATLTLLTVLYCSILSKQAVQDLGAWRRQEGYSEHHRNYHKASHCTPLTPKHCGTGRALGGD